MSFVEIFLPFPGNPFSPLGDLWRIPLGPPPTPSWPFAVLRGPSWKSFCLFLEILSPLGDLWRIPLGPPPTPSWPFAVLRGPSWISFCLFLEILPPTRPLAGPSRASANPFVALRRSSWPFVEIFLPFPGNPFSPLGDPWRIPLEPPPTPSWPFAVLRGPSWKSFCLFLEILSPLGDLWRIPLEPPPTPSWPFAVLRGPSWKSFCLFLEILSPLGDLWRIPLGPPPTPSWPFVDIFLPFPGNPFSPWRPLADPSRASANPFVALRRSSWPFVDKSFLSVRGSSWIPSWITLFPCWSV